MPKPRAAVRTVVAPSSSCRLLINPVRQMMARTTGRAVCVLAGGLSHPSTEKAAADALIWATWPRSQSPAPADGEGTATTAIAGDGVPSGGGAGRVGWWKVSLQAPSTARAISAGLPQKAAAGGRSALALLRAPFRGLCLARQPPLGASHASQRRRPATHSEGGRPALAEPTVTFQQKRAGGRQC